MANVEEPSLWGELERQVLGAGERLAALDAKYLVLIDDTYTDLFTGEAIAPKRLDENAWERFIETTHKVADIARDKFGLQLVFHPHAETHVEYEDQIETFLEQTDPDRVSICFDTGHHAYRGGDPINFMRRHHDRIPYLHLKSIDPEIQKRVEANGIPFAEAVKMDMFVEPSKGAVDFLAFRDLLQEIDYNGYAIVEQDMYPAPFDKPLPIAKRTRANICVRLGLDEGNFWSLKRLTMREVHQQFHVLAGGYMDMYRVGIMGCGRIASTMEDESDVHPISIAGAFDTLPNTELVAGCNRGAEKLHAFGKRWDVDALYHDYREMLAKEDLDIVCRRHAPTAAPGDGDCLRRGRCEGDFL